jgi:hypothetical protein
MAQDNTPSVGAGVGRVKRGRVRHRPQQDAVGPGKVRHHSSMFDDPLKFRYRSRELVWHRQKYII